MVEMERRSQDTLKTEESGAADAAGQPPTHVVAIGASAGGLEALERMFQVMPADTGVAFVVVQHLSPDFKSLMDELLARWTDMPIQAVADQMPIAANGIFLMPPKTEMIISDGRFLLTPREPGDEPHLPIDKLFRSLAREAADKAIAVVLSGTGSDGSRGIRDIHEAGGYVIAQSDDTAKFDGMPKSAVETGVVDEVLAPQDIARRLLAHIGHPRQIEQPVDDESEMSPIFRLLRDKYRIDFSYYKPSTVTRRTQRRLQMSRTLGLEDYVEQLRDDPEELDALYRDLLVGVTSFFRDPDAFQVLERDVIPELLGRTEDNGEFRVWASGCATGEEAYSLAILIHEQIRKSGRPIIAKVFATDVHKKVLEFAAHGVYDEQAVAAVTNERLKEYFIRTDNGFRVSSELRKMVVFAPHNVIRDAPFTRMDLISCRNLLIYLVPNAQTKALSLFHFGLKTGGVLFLGSSESPGELSSEFEAIDQHWNVYRKRRDVKLPADLRLPLSPGLSAGNASLSSARRQQNSPLGDIFERLLDETLPPSVLVNEHLEIVHTFGNASEYLRLRRGTASLRLSDMLSEKLRTAVAAAVHRSSREDQTVTFSHVETRSDELSETINLTVTPLPATHRTAAHTLIRFEQIEVDDPPRRETLGSLSDATMDHVEALESELRYTKENLQATVEELETSNEELQATNEELLASNEELQSTNEELHSVNEELYTVNAEYQKKIEEQTELTQDLNNLLSSTDVHTMFLDDELRIRKFTPRISQVFHLIASDIGRSIQGFVHTLQGDSPIELPTKLNAVLQSGEPHEEEVRNADGRYFLMRLLPYQSETELAGVVLTLIDVTVLKEAQTRFSNAIEVSPNGMLIVDAKGCITLVNSKIKTMFGYSEDELVGQPLETLLPKDQHRSHAELTRTYFQRPRVIQRMGQASFVWGERKDGSHVPLDVRVNPIQTPRGVQAIASLFDVSDYHELQDSLRQQVQQRDRFLATLSHELRNPMGAILTAASVLRTAAGELPEMKKPCAVIRRQASQIATLLDDLLDVSRVTQGKIKLRSEAVDLVDVCHESIEAVTPLVEKHRHKLIFDSSDEAVWVEADRVRMVQVVQNLLTNAIKYTPDGGNIELSARPENEQATIRVRDDGCGMSRELLGSVFDMFVQSDQTLDRSEGGMGVGLTLVRSLVELHSGTIDAFSDGPEKGSQFVVRLPLTANRPDSDETKNGKSRAPQEVRLILVEDNDDAREMMGELLTRSGYNLLAAAENGAKGLDLIMQHQPDVALLDLGLPELDGYQIARRVRKDLGGDIHLIALTGYGRDEDHEAVLEAGFNEHLVKPVNLKQLATILDVVPTPVRKAD